MNDTAMNAYDYDGRGTTPCMRRILTGARLKALRGSTPQYKIADKLGVSVSCISMYESGKRIPGDEKKRTLAKLFSKSVEEIFFAD